MSGSLPTGFPIRTSAGHRAFAPHRGFSQLITSFIASESHRHPPCALVHFLCSFALATTALERQCGRTFAYIRLARFFRFSQLNRLIFLVLRSHHVNDLFKIEEIAELNRSPSRRVLNDCRDALSAEPHLWTLMTVAATSTLIYNKVCTRMIPCQRCTLPVR